MLNNTEEKTPVHNKRKREIAICGLKVFCEKGYDNTSVDDIVKKAKCSHGLFYHYFKSKAELFNEVMRIKEENRRNELQKILDETPSYIGKLKIILEDLFNKLVNEENFTYYFYFFITQKFINKEKGIPPKERKPDDKKPPFLVSEDFFEQGQKNGEFTQKYSAKECVKLFFSIIHGATIGYVIAPKDVQKSIILPNVDFIADIFKKEK